MNKRTIAIHNIVLVALAAAILFVQEEVLSFLPNIQLTVLLIIVYTKCFGFTRTTTIVLIHTILDNIFMGSFNIIYFPFMFCGWEAIVLLVTLIKKAKEPWQLAILSGFGALIYSLLFVIPQTIIMKVDFFIYIIQDIPFTLILITSSVLSVLWLYKPLVKVLLPYTKNIQIKQGENEC